ncbi:MAG: adenylyl-sulfate kinase [Clostridiales bacterium]|nr:adenylyl-sulfate kinase [Clostridiales bacterium]
MSKNIYYSTGNIGDEDRKNLTGHKGRVFWFYGLSGSGKSAISRAVEENLINNGVLSFRLDGDNLRSGLNNDLGFSKIDRIENIRRAAETAKLLAEAGVVVLATFITPLNENRQTAQKILGDYFNEIYVKCSIETCKMRDPKGLYERALKGEIPDFTGISAPFEEPYNNVFFIDTDNLDEKTSIENATKHIMNILK